MKKILLFCLIPFLLLACDDKKSDDNGNSGSGNGNHSGSQSGNDDAKVLDNLIAKGELTSDEIEMIKSECRESEPNEYDECVANSMSMVSVIKAINCLDKFKAVINCDSEDCEDETSGALSICFATNIKSYAKDIESTAMYKAMDAYESRETNCCHAWEGEDFEYCDEERNDDDIEKYLSTLMYVRHKCASQFIAAYECGGKLACNEASDTNDSNTIYALCSASFSSVYIGNNYSDAESCEADLTYHCQDEMDAVDACLGNSDRD